jgi:hypothetical protein
VAFKQYFRLARENEDALAHRVELVLFPGGYAGLLFLPQGIMNLCLLVKRPMLQRLGNRWPNLLAHIKASSSYFGQYVDDAAPLLPKPLALSSIPYGYVCRDARCGLWRLGDQAAVIPSFSGDGVSIALHSAFLAASYFLEGRSADEFQRRLSGPVLRPIEIARVISKVMVAAPSLAAGARMWPRMLGLISQQTRIKTAALLEEFG